MQKIMRVNRLRHISQELKPHHENISAHEYSNNGHSQYDLRKLENALMLLTKEDKALLLDFFDHSKRSIRSIARAEGSSRYSAEQKVAIALIKLLMGFEKPEGLPSINWKVRATA